MPMVADERPDEAPAPLASRTAAAAEGLALCLEAGCETAGLPTAVSGGWKCCRGALEADEAASNEASMSPRKGAFVNVTTGTEASA